MPRWAFEKLPGASPVLGTQMQSVGEVMAIGRTFPESLQKALRSLEAGRRGLNADPAERVYERLSDDELVRAASTPTPDRVFLVEAALRRGVSIERLHDATGIDPWFLDQVVRITDARRELAEWRPESMSRLEWRRTKRLGFSDGQLAHLWDTTESDVRAARLDAGIGVTFKTVDTCAAEFSADTPYHYGTYEDEDEVAALDRRAVVILGSGPNRIGQGVEFDYCCVHAAFALSEAGYETVMVNCNPETVSTDYDTSDRLFFEPLCMEDVANVCDALGRDGKNLAGVIVSLGGQTPLKLAHALEAAGTPVLGTSPASIDLAEDRERFNDLCARLGIPQPPGSTVATPAAARAAAERIGYPVLVRPSYVLGGRAMQIVYDAEGLDLAMAEIGGEGSLGREGGLSAERPALIDRFLEDATEVDVDAVRDHTGDLVIGGVMEHIEQAGVHSGDSACAIPPPTLAPGIVRTIEQHTRALADALDVRGLLNVQYAVKEAVLPFDRFPDVDTILGPEMRSTGEVMGIDRSFGLAFAKSQAAGGNRLPVSGTVFFSLADRDKYAGLAVARRFAELGFSLVATAGTAAALQADGLPVSEVVSKVGEGSSQDGGVDAVELISSGKVDLVVNTPRGHGPRTDGDHIRRAATRHRVACITTIAAALAAAAGIAERAEHAPVVRSLQEYHRDGQLRLGV